MGTSNRLYRALQKIKNTGMTLNKSKCEFKKESITFLGHVIDARGISQDLDKIAAVAKMPQPTTVTELRHYQVFPQNGEPTQQVTPHAAELSQPLRELLSAKRSWVWGPAQQEALTGRIVVAHCCSAEIKCLWIHNPHCRESVSGD